MRNQAIIIGVAAALGITPAAAAAQTAQGKATEAKQADSKKKVCRWFDTTGSKRLERVCLTADDWKKVELEAQKL